jgi:hypothetical protein
LQNAAGLLFYPQEPGFSKNTSSSSLADDWFFHPYGSLAAGGYAEA